MASRACAVLTRPAWRAAFAVPQYSSLAKTQPSPTEGGSGSTPGTSLNHAVTGNPAYLRNRTVRIYSPAKTAMQSGLSGVGYWMIDFDVIDKWENPLMGWTSSADPVQALNIKFAEKEDAIAFAEKQGYEYWIEEPKKPKFKKKAYGDNFTYVPGNIRLFKTK